MAPITFVIKREPKVPNWCNLPKEVLNIIFLYVKSIDKVYKNKKLFQCSLTCHSWRSPAQNVIFSEISVNTTNDIDSLNRTILENDGFKKWAKVLNYSKTCTCNTTTLFAADLLFSKLEALTFCGNNVLYSFFCKMLIENGKFKNLTKLPTPANKEQDLMYSRCLDFLQERITAITLIDDESNNRDIYQDVIKKLDRFPKLKSALIYTTITDMQYQNLVKYINPLIENNLTSSLKELCITSTANESHCFRVSTQGEKGLLPMMKLKSLNIYMYSDKYFTISEDLMLFIMHQCPNLDSIYVKIDGRTLSCLDTFRYQQTLLQFMIYLLKMPNFFLKNSVLATKEAIQLIENYYTAIEKESTSQKLSRALIITDDPRGSTGDSFGVIAFKNDYSMRLQSVDFQLFCSNKNTPKHKVDEEQIQLVEKIGHFFNTVSLQITSSEYLATLLKCVTEIDCQRLNTLIIEGRSKSIYKESFLLDKEIAYNNSIKELVLSNCCLSQEQLLCISIVLPRLEKLVLKNFLRHKSLLLSGKSFFSICLPNLSLDCLEIDVDLCFTGSQKEEKYYIKLVTEVEQNSRYCFFTVKFADNNKVTGYILADNPTQAAFQESISNQEISTYFIYCASVKEFTFKYIDAETKHHKALDIVGEPVKE